MTERVSGNGMKPAQRIVWVVFALLMLYVAALGMRRYVLHAQYRVLGGVPPFTLESALQFRQVEQVYHDGHLPRHDPDVQYPEGIRPARTDTVGAEYIYAGLARFWPSGVSLDDRVRWITAAWFCLGIPLVALWIVWWTGSLPAGILAGAFYAVSIASVIRSTGQELSRENFAMPLLVAHLAFMAGALRDGGSRTSFRILCGLSAVALAAAVSAWDMIQFYLLLWVAAAYIRLVAGWWREAANSRTCWLVQWGALMAAGTLVPYMRAHDFLLSPVMTLSYGVVIAMALAPRLSRRWVLALVALAPAIVLRFLGDGYDASYGHFAELLQAKIRYLNQKPTDPSLLTFHQRIMWVPALNSASWTLTRYLYPAILWVSLVAGAVAALYLNRNQDRQTRLKSNLLQLIFFFGSSVIAYVLFVRFHVFVALFAVALIGWLAAWTREHRGTVQWAAWFFLVAGLSVEASVLLHEPERWGRPGVYYAELVELTEWLKEHISPDPVLANFGVSASILAYGRCPIILHPKFESPGIRDRVRAYGEALFKGTERSFRNWADEAGARYYVYSVGEFARRSPELQMRYFVDALEPPDFAPARLFESTPEDGLYFHYVWGNRKYRVFRIVSRDDEEMAGEWTRRAEEAFQRGDLVRAEWHATSALMLFPHQYRAAEVLLHINSLREQGFSYEAYESE